jgi:hypothetical protein
MVIGSLYHYATVSTLLLCELLFICIILCVLILSSQHGSRTHLSHPISMVVKFKLKFKFKLNSNFKFKFLWIYSKFCSDLNSSSSLNSNFSELNPNSNLGWGPQFLSYWFYSKYCLNSNSNSSLI